MSDILFETLHRICVQRANEPNKVQSTFLVRFEEPKDWSRDRVFWDGDIHTHTHRISLHVNIVERKAEIWWSRKMWIAITMQTNELNEWTNKFTLSVQSIRWSSNVHVPFFMLPAMWREVHSFYCHVEIGCFLSFVFSSTIEKMQLNNNGKWHTEQTMWEK